MMSTPRCRYDSPRPPSVFRPTMRTLAILLALLLVSACGGKGGGEVGPIHPLLIPANAFDDGPAMDAASWITPQALAAGLEDGSLILTSAAQLAQDEQDAQARMVADKASAEALYATRNDILMRHTMGPAGGDPNFVPLPDGNWLYRVRAANPTSGQPAQHVVIKGNRTNYAELVHVTERFNDRDNQLNVYKDMYSRLDPAYISKRGLPDPSSLGTLAVDQLIILNDDVASDWPTFQLPGFGAPPSGYPGSANAEEGHGYGGDSANLTSPTGIWSQVNFPLKWCTTSVKWQGSRGACTVFAITAGMEAMIARDYGRWVNLSEQMFYNRAKQIWWPSEYGDNLNTGGTLFQNLLNVYRYSWESSWDYNPSPWRVDLTFASLYQLSCWANETGSLSYQGEHCSDSNHQAPMVCSDLGPYSICTYQNPASDVPPDSNFRLTGFTALNDPGIVGVFWARAMLALKIPVVISITVPVLSMDGGMVNPNNGIVTYLSGEPSSGAGHAMLLVGYVANADLAAGTPLGSGGGYFICKNSWGAGYGDGGYIYLPDNWVLAWARSLYALKGVTDL